MEQSNNNPKSFVERVQEIDRTLTELKDFKGKAEVALQDLMSMLTQLVLQMRFMGEQLQAIYDLGENGKTITRANVIEAANERRVKAIRDMIDRDLKNGLIKPVESVMDANTLVVYKSENVMLAFKSADGFKEEGLELSDLLGKKVGDEIKGVKIVELYSVAEQ